MKMVNIDELTIEMLQTLFPDVASPGFSTGAAFTGWLALAAFALFIVTLVRKWHESWTAFYLFVAMLSGVVFLILCTDHRNVWRNTTLPGALSRDPEAAVVIERVRKDIKWINERAEARAKEKQDGK
jgi:hypothetical protein